MNPKVLFRFLFGRVFAGAREGQGVLYGRVTYLSGDDEFQGLCMACHALLALGQ